MPDYQALQDAHLQDPPAQPAHDEEETVDSFFECSNCGYMIVNFTEEDYLDDQGSLCYCQVEAHQEEDSTTEKEEEEMTMSKKIHPDFVVSKDNYKGRDTNLDLINLTLNFHPDPSANPLWIRDGLTDFISEQLAFHVDDRDFDVYDIAVVMALAAEQSLRDMNLNRFPNTGKNY